MSFRLLSHKPTVTVRVDLGVTPITTAAWLQLVAALGAPACAVEIYNPTGATIMLSTGAAGLEAASTLPYSILPGGSSILLPFEFKNGGRISAKAVDQDATNNIFVLNFLG